MISHRNLHFETKNVLLYVTENVWGGEENAIVENNNKSTGILFLL